jgi:hypothetical protein
MKMTNNGLCTPSVALSLLSFGCATSPPLESEIDSKGRTEVRSTAVVTLARAQPRFSEAARDYLYLAPVERNEQGTRRYYLWLGLATTVDRPWVFAEPKEAETLVLVIDGLPVALPLSSWDAPPDVVTPAPIYAVRRAQVTLDELERLTSAASIEVRVTMTDGAPAPFSIWRGEWTDWLPFVAGVDPVRSAASD